MSQRSTKRKIGSIGGIKAFQRSKKSDNMEESGIKFFPEPKNESENYEVRIDTTENDFKSDLLQFLHLQACQLEDIRDLDLHN